MSSPMDVPALETERLTLRGHAAADLDDCVAMWGDPTVTRYIGGRPFGADEVWSKILRYAGHWALFGFGYWVVREKTSGRFVGEVGLADFRRDIEPSFRGAPEAGWALAPWAHGKGFATEAVRAALVWCDGRFGRIRTVCMIGPENVPSIRVAEKCGFCHWTTTTYKGDKTILFER